MKPPPALKSEHVGIGAQLAPPAAVALLIVAAAAGHAAAGASGEPANVAVVVGVAAFVLAVLVGIKRGERITCPKSKSRLYGFLAVCATWLTTVTATGVSWGAIEILSLMIGALSLHWWSVRRIPNAAPVPVVTGSMYEDRWKDNVAASGCALPGSRLLRAVIKTFGIQYDLMLVPGKQNQSSVSGALKLIRGGLGLKAGQDLLVEAHPTLPEPHLRLTIITRSPIRSATEWPGPSAFNAKTGKVRLGPFVDGIGAAEWTVYTPTRLKGGFIQGGTNSGKSRMIDSIGLSVAGSDSHPTVIMYGDGQGGASSPMLSKHADHVALTPERCLEMLRGLMLVMALRQDENALEGLSGFTPSADRPGILVILDECHKFLTVYADATPELAAIIEQIQAMVSTLIREGGKVGMACLLASQQATLDAFGGSGSGNVAETIRSNILAGNGVMLRSKGPNAKQVFKVEVDPSQFPDIPGYGYLVDPIEGARSAPFRGLHLTDQQVKVWPQRIRWRSLDVGSANAYGHGYLNRHAQAAADRAEKQARVDARRAGKPAPTPAPATPRIERTITASAAKAIGVAQFPIWDPSSMRRPVEKLQPQTEAPGGAGYAKVSAALAAGTVLRDGGYTTPALLAEAVDLSTRHVNTILRHLEKAGHVRRGETQGHYYPTRRETAA